MRGQWIARDNLLPFDLIDTDFNGSVAPPPFGIERIAR